ncbi:MAG: exopolyphosphatase / guanosine-5-triphosphate,3-diphosphate pyrophosphatase [Campylobacterota bacterium]|nr:exopolyphosphatase / guanosine-5-triphosphate,3-diphosphate pyrophosphatase [Campylobacterota bacterium]
MTAIDLGSNTIRFLNYDCKNKKEINSLEFIVRTAQDLHISKNISDEATERIIDAILKAKNSIGIDSSIKAVATAAFRIAKNSKEVIQKIKSKTSIEFEIIDADKEAEYTALAMYSAVKRDFNQKSIFVLDIGGASTEIIYKDDKNIVSKSFDIGIVTSANKFGGDENALILSLEPMLNSIDLFIKDIASAYDFPEIFTATSGTPTTLAAIKQGMTYYTYDKEKINSTMLSLKDINDAHSALLKMNEDLRVQFVGSNRVDLVMCGVVIFKEILKKTNYSQCVVYDDGLREGVAIAFCDDTQKK